MSAPHTVHVDFGDGASAETTEQATVHHDYTDPGTYTITATEPDGATGTTQFTVEEAVGPAQPTLTVEPVTITAGGTATQPTTLHNDTGQSANVTGRLVITGAAAAGLDPAALSCVMPDPHDGQDATVDWAAGGDDVVGTYGPYPIGTDPTNSGGTQNNQWAVADDAPAGTYTASTELLDTDADVVIATADWAITIEAAP